ncbi:MAG: LamG-like jellyroll fold domain-containing protein [Bacteroidales bacterium]|jgi:hypothetical protein
MKIIKYLFFCSLIAAFAVSCDKGLDPINYVKPGPDTLSPTLTINFPTEGKLVSVKEEFLPVTFKLVAADDIELKSVILQLDGTEIYSITTFIDYRRLELSYDKDSISNGNHVLTVTVTDLADKSVAQSINFMKITTPVYTPLDGEVLYFRFDGDYLDAISGKELTVVGTSGFADVGKVNLAYAGATDAYMTYPTEGILGSEFSVAFWYKLNAVPQRGGIMSISRPYTVYNDSTRFKGLRILRENNGTTKANLGLNFGIGAAEVWMNPFITVDTASVWMHIAISISDTSATIYFNGEAVKEQSIVSKLDWTDCSSMSIASGQPNFIYWDHLSDLSLYDEMHIFKRAITAEEVQAFYAIKKRN